MRFDLKEMRAELGFTQAELSRLSGLSLPLIQKLEYGEGNPSLETLHKLGRVLGFEVKLTSCKPDWSVLVKAGVPLHGYAPYVGKVSLHRLLVEFKNAWSSELDQRHREALAALLLSLQTHYPSVWKRHFSRFNWPGVDEGRILKLSRLCFDGLQEIV